MAVFLVPARTDTKWFHEICLPFATEIRFIKGRLRFGDGKNPAPFPSMIVVFESSRAKRELANLQMLLESGHPDQRGIKQGIEDWIVQDAADHLGKK